LIINLTTNETLVERLHQANQFWKRLTGLMTFKTMKSSEGMLLTPCSDIHTCFMKFPIDVICLDNNLTILEVHCNIKPWRFIMGCKNTVSILEVPVGVASSLRIGDQLKIVN